MNLQRTPQFLIGSVSSPRLALGQNVDQLATAHSLVIRLLEPIFWRQLKVGSRETTETLVKGLALCLRYNDTRHRSSLESESPQLHMAIEA
ncbi:hypothetical protein VNO77_23217 [Canavalia gladiata]|uniref:Uncharacterized protein n=1 Tax=Canavalia gladiata TaxID=3824 RepID=A0AAN9QBI6_CANGL